MTALIEMIIHVGEYDMTGKRVCAWCDWPFVPTSGRQLYCQLKCRRHMARWRKLNP